VLILGLITNNAKLKLTKLPSSEYDLVWAAAQKRKFASFKAGVKRYESGSALKGEQSTRSSGDSYERQRSDKILELPSVGDFVGRNKVFLNLCFLCKKILEEIVATELDFVRDITTLIYEWKKPIEDDQLLPRNDVDAIFSNIDAIQQLHAKFLGKLQHTLKQDSEVESKILSISKIMIEMVNEASYYTNVVRQRTVNHSTQNIVLVKKML
jgi:hypothetical protein